MKLLAFDTSTDALSIAVAAPGLAAPLQHHGAGGPQASTTLLPAVLDLLARAGLAIADLDAIAFGAGEQVQHRGQQGGGRLRAAGAVVLQGRGQPGGGHRDAQGIGAGVEGEELQGGDRDESGLSSAR